MRVLVTGGAGYIGSHVVFQLINAGHKVIIIDNFSTGHMELVHPMAKLIKGSVGDEAVLKSAAADGAIDAVMHFAASIEVEESVREPLKYYKNNFIETLTLVQFCVQMKIPRFIFSSTAAVYSDKNGSLISESDKLDPLSPYGFSKLSCEQLLLDVKKAVPFFSPIIFRYFNVAGAREDNSIGQMCDNATHLIKVACEVITGKRSGMTVFGNDYPTDDGTAERDYIHVEDVASAHLLGLTYKAEKSTENPIFNLGYGKSYSVMEILNTLEKVAGRKINYSIGSRRPGDASSIAANPKKAQSELLWNPKYASIDYICSTAYKWESKRNAREHSPTV